MELIGSLVWAGCFLFLALMSGLALYKSTRKKPAVTSVPPTVITQQIDLTPLVKQMQELPSRVLNSIQSSTNTIKGSLAEHIAYLQLSAEYDRIVPLGSIVDFMCIKFPEGGNKGHVDFIDVKTGRSARLNKDQRSLQKLIEDKRINFRKLQISTVVNEDTVDGSSSGE